MVDIRIRSGHPDDIPFIYATTLKSLHHDSMIGKMIRSTTFFKNYRNVLDRILFDSEVFVACDKVDTEVIYGFLIIQRPNIIHYAFTKEAFRKLHIQTKLLNVANLTVPYVITHRTKSANFCKYEFNPFLLYKKSEGDVDGR